jgi:hypothetical protein
MERMTAQRETIVPEVVTSPTTPVRNRQLAIAGILAGLVGSTVALGIAPALMPDSYSWVEHTTSQSAAQGVEGAWLARLGFLLFGLTVLWLARTARRRWGVMGVTLHGAFGIAIVATATFSTRSWVAGAAFDPVEDLLHSIAATGMGFAFAIGIANVAVRRPSGSMLAWGFDVLAIAASVLLPLGMMAFTGHAGALQRLMFLIAYVWYGVEAVRSMACASDISNMSGEPGSRAN